MTKLALIVSGVALYQPGILNQFAIARDLYQFADSEIGGFACVLAFCLSGVAIAAERAFPEFKI